MGLRLCSVLSVSLWVKGSLKPCKILITLRCCHCLVHSGTWLAVGDSWWLCLQAHRQGTSKGQAANAFFIHFDLLVVPFLNLGILFCLSVMKCKSVTQFMLLFHNRVYQLPDYTKPVCLLKVFFLLLPKYCQAMEFLNAACWPVIWCSKWLCKYKHWFLLFGFLIEKHQSTGSQTFLLKAAIFGV